eukprot:COSAG02_NODE_950_length_15694_cov_34.317794_12_plen_62_part_00
MFLFASLIVVAWMNMMLIGRANAAASAGSKPHLMYILAVRSAPLPASVLIPMLSSHNRNHS